MPSSPDSTPVCSPDSFDLIGDSSGRDRVPAGGRPGAGMARLAGELALIVELEHSHHIRWNEGARAGYRSR